MNDIGHRTGVTLSGNQFSVSGIAWGYDAMGQVTTADRAGGTTGDRGYKWDGIGNRYRSSRNTTNPDTAGGANLSVYQIGTTDSTPDGANALNQYRRGGIYGTTGVNQTYDLDGNQDSVRYPNGGSGARYWDGENRMYRTTVGSANTYHAYDPFGRRVAKFQGSGTAMTGRIYFYDGWNVAAECSIASSTYPLDRTYTWGPDLSGSMQGAGGVGGLLSVEIETGGDACVYYPTYDGNGNVSEYLDATAVVVAHIEYDPFGEEVVATGSKVALFNYRFSTKPLDTETGYHYYGYRFYDPVTGRWPSRDPIGERGGMNLYGFLRNNGISKIDLLGMLEPGQGVPRPLPPAPKGNRKNFDEPRSDPDHVPPMFDGYKLHHSYFVELKKAGSGGRHCCCLFTNYLDSDRSVSPAGTGAKRGLPNHSITVWLLVHGDCSSHPESINVRVMRLVDNERGNNHPYGGIDILEIADGTVISKDKMGTFDLCSSETKAVLTTAAQEAAKRKEEFDELNAPLKDLVPDTTPFGSGNDFNEGFGGD